jgi:alpha-tubulin suppressor-like RCC1 family protein
MPDKPLRARGAHLRLVLAGTACLLLWACSKGSDDRAIVRRYLLCEECQHKEGEAVLDSARRDRMVPLLAKALEGLTASRRANLRRQLEETYRLLAIRAIAEHSTVPLTEVDYVAHFLSNHEATYQLRAVSALAAIGTPQAKAVLEAAAEAVRTGALLARGDVVEELSAAIGAPIARGAVAWQSISAGSLHTCGIRSDGKSYCWGRNDQGQLGDGSTAPRPTPTLVAGGLRFSSISAGAAGGSHTCGVAVDSVYCWGSNPRGQLGDGGTSGHDTPTSVAGGIAFVGVAVGGEHTCAWTAAHEAYCWGANNVGQLGDGTISDRHQPVASAKTLSVHSMGAGTGHTCADALSQRLYCWGQNDKGQLGDGSTTDRPNPVLEARARRLRSFSLGTAHTCGLVRGGAASTEGLAFCGGFNVSGRLGDGTDLEKDSLIAVAGRYRFQTISAGENHTCGIVMGTRQLRCWGANNFGQLGDGTTTDHLLPVTVADSLSFAAVSAGAGHTCGITTQGIAYCWGRNTDGQLGNGTNFDVPTPVPVSSP